MIKTEKGHFWITFENGLTLSIFNGFGSYTENHFNYELAEEKETRAESHTCEIAVFKNLDNNEWFTNEFIDCEGDDVKGNVTPEELAEIIYKVKNYKIDD